jgi:hypothetical protein
LQVLTLLRLFKQVEWNIWRRLALCKLMIGRLLLECFTDGCTVNMIARQNSVWNNSLR